MPLEYTNRRGDRYYVLEGKTKTGKPKYYCSKKTQGTPVERLPLAYEIYEHPRDAVVTIRRVRPSPIHLVEREMLEKWTHEYAADVPTIVAVEEDALVVYSTDIAPDQSLRLMRLLVGETLGRKFADGNWSRRFANYSPMFRFQLVDEFERLYTIERWCFYDDIDGWYLLGGYAPLDKLARDFLPHLGKESFFELM
jgi:hypothetical protein